MFRNDFQFELEKLVREDIMKKKLSHMLREHVNAEIEHDPGDTAEAFIDYNNLPVGFPSVIQRFMDIDCTWNPEDITNILWNYETREMDTQIANLQQVVDKYSPTPGASRIKELRKEKTREPPPRRLKHMLAAKALRSIERKRGLVDANGIPPVEDTTTKSLPMQQWPSTPFYRDRLQSMRAARLKSEKADKDQYLAKLTSAQNGKKGFYGKWKFKNEEEERVARIFMKSVEDREITADDVAVQAMDATGPSIFRNIQLVWAPNPLIVKLAVDPARLKALLEGLEVTSKKRKQQPEPEVPSGLQASSAKKQKLRASQNRSAGKEHGDNDGERPRKLKRRKEQSTAQDLGVSSARKPEIMPDIKPDVAGRLSIYDGNEDAELQVVVKKRKATSAPEIPSTVKRLKLNAPGPSCTETRRKAEEIREEANIDEEVDDEVDKQFREQVGEQVGEQLDGEAEAQNMAR